MPESIISVSHLSKRYGAAMALDDVSLQVAEGEMVALIGASGSGKSTLLRHLAGFLVADRASGEIRVAGHLIQAQGRLSPKVRRARSSIGFVFQQFNLVGRLSVLTNVLLGSLAQGSPVASSLGWFDRRKKAAAARALVRVGIVEHAYRRASELSGGQQQRVAIARAVVQGADVILADEPIASLDPESARNVMEILAGLNQEQRKTIVVSLHQVDYARRYCARTVALRRGQIVFDGPSSQLSGAMLRDLYGGDAAGLEAQVDRAAGPEAEGETRQLRARELEAAPAVAEI